MSEKRLTKGIYAADVSGNAGGGRPRKTYPDLIGEILQKGRVRSTRNRRACMTREEYVRIVAGGVLWFLPTPMRKRREFMYVCMNYLLLGPR